MSNEPSTKLLSFCKNFTAQYWLTLYQKNRKTLDKGKHVGTVFMDLSKVLDTINHDLLIARVEDLRVF